MILDLIQSINEALGRRVMRISRYTMPLLALSVFSFADGMEMQLDLRWAIEGRNFEKVHELYLQGVNLNHQNGKGETPLHIAAAHGAVLLVEQLLYWGADPLIEDDGGRKPFQQKGCRCSNECKCPKSSSWCSIQRLVRNALKERDGARPMMVIKSKTKK